MCVHSHTEGIIYPHAHNRMAVESRLEWTLLFKKIRMPVHNQIEGSIYPHAHIRSECVMNSV